MDSTTTIEDESGIASNALIAEIQELRDKKILEDDGFRFVMMVGNRPPVIPKMEFVYPDYEIHDDVLKLIKYSCGELSSGKQMDEILNTWISIFEPMLGARAPETEDAGANGRAEMDVASINAVTVGSVDGHIEGVVELVQDERVGELSPNGDFGEENFATYGNGDVAAAQGLNEEVGENDVDDKGSGNAYENDDVTSSESSYGENGSHEEDDHDENNVDSESEAEVVDNGHVIEGDGMLLSSSQPHLETAKPLRKHVGQPSQAKEKDSRIFYGNDAIYVLFRLHQVLYDRILTAKVNTSERRWRGSQYSNSTNPYTRFLSSLYNLLDGTINNTKFEDECRAIIGTQSDILITLDKLIYKIVKQLQAIVTDEPKNQLFQLYTYEKSRKAKSFDDATYHRNVSILLQKENIYRIECFSSPTHMSIHLMEKAYEEHDGVSDPKYLDFVYNDYLASIPKLTSGIFLNRNKRKYPGEDQDSAALDEVQLVNGLQMIIRPTSHGYFCDTEDLLFRSRNKKRNGQQNGLVHDQAKFSKKLIKSQRFNRWLSGP